MKLSLQALSNQDDWKGYHLPTFDLAKMKENTAKTPSWLHFGAGNIFRAFPVAVCQSLLEKGLYDRGVICCEGYDEEIITKCFRPYDNLTVAVTLNVDGTMDKDIIAAVAESLTLRFDMDRVVEIFQAPSLQMASFTITEKGYAIENAAGVLLPMIAADMENSPSEAKSFMAQLTAFCIRRFHACGAPLALVSMDNCSHNGEKLQNAVLTIARGWLKNKKITPEELAYLETKISFPWSMIDKITPRPDQRVEDVLKADGLTEISPFITAKNTYVAPFVNAEKAQYLVIEDDFPNGRPPLDKAGIIFTDRDTVNRVEKMKVCTCLNPLHTCLAIYGCLLGYTSIAEEMKDVQLKDFIYKMSDIEGMPVVVNPGIVDPKSFLNEVLTQRFPNPFMPDTPQRIATDTSQKLSVRFGETLKAYMDSGKSVAELVYIPLVFAGWLRYVLGVDDQGEAFDCSSDPLLAEVQQQLSSIHLGGEIKEETLAPLLKNAAIFGVDLYEVGLAPKVFGYFKELCAEKGAVRATLKKYIG